MKDITLADLGWSAHFSNQITSDSLILTPPARVCDIHRDRLVAITETGNIALSLPPFISAGDLAVGDWILIDPDTNQVRTLLERRTTLTRQAAGPSGGEQLIAANVDTLMIVTSCNSEFNPARLERYIALAMGSGTFPVIVLTKADLTTETDDYKRQAERLSPLATVLAVNARESEELVQLNAWLRVGETAALVGSSGVGKSTILNGLTGLDVSTQAIRENDEKGRHTTTSRSLRRTVTGGWLIDTPGVRSLGMSDSDAGIEQVFSDLLDLAAQCKFTDCAHETEHGCAVKAAIERGELEADRLVRWQKLQRENQYNSETIAQSRTRYKKFGRQIKSILSIKRQRTR
ncbi:MAG: ribosome small subunit-dependent GTPase A [Candidatus Competibacteraceae bacterium]|jgi:ribosome biogenesis GTPase|nr:ribosome small subunit-dependent GTPase A [Candidatus Competibacteraceae bacterium]